MVRQLLIIVFNIATALLGIRISHILYYNIYIHTYIARPSSDSEDIGVIEVIYIYIYISRFFTSCLNVCYKEFII